MRSVRGNFSGERDTPQLFFVRYCLREKKGIVQQHFVPYATLNARMPLWRNFFLSFQRAAIVFEPFWLSLFGENVHLLHSVD